MSEYRVVLVMAASEEEAEKIGTSLVEERLAACVNVLPGLRSIYRWQGAIQKETEALMIIKTTADLFLELARRVAELHSYDVPEVLSLPISGCTELPGLVGR